MAPDELADRLEAVSARRPGTLVRAAEVECQAIGYWMRWGMPRCCASAAALAGLELLVICEEREMAR